MSDSNRGKLYKYDLSELSELSERVYYWEGGVPSFFYLWQTTEREAMGDGLLCSVNGFGWWGSTPCGLTKPIKL